MMICFAKKNRVILLLGFLAPVTASLFAYSQSDNHVDDNHVFEKHVHDNHVHENHALEKHAHDKHAHDNPVHENHTHEHQVPAEAHDEHNHEEGVVEIADDMAAGAGISTTVAGPGEINKTLTVYGRVIADPSRISHIRARFPGTITRVIAGMGDQVKKGQVLAEVESNESLKRYALKAPFSGIITAHHASPGEATEEQVLFTVADFDQVWAEFQIFPGQLSRVGLGQSVAVSVASRQTITMIRHLIPSDGDKPFVLARAPIDNRLGHWAPGLLLQGQISVEQIQADLRVDNRALQTVGSQEVVFVKSGEHYEARSLTLGHRDRYFSEVLEGLYSGEQYVVENSYLIKADLEKSGAAHEH